ncbi:MAG: FHA domain-containing protein [Planctomycetes bacterium]|nr:FHA domain-containing protein [Planctomycetota bacterium]
MARIIVISGSEKGSEFALGPSQTIGRLAANEIPVHDDKMSRRNTKIFRQGKSWVIQDLESKNGTYLNGRTIEASTLTDNDEIRVGETFFSFLADAEPAEPLSASAIRSPNMDDVALATKAGSRKGGGSVSDRVLSYSPHGGENQTRTSLFFLRQDLGQRDGTFKVMVFLGLILIMAGLFWLVQMLVAGA